MDSRCPPPQLFDLGQVCMLQLGINKDKQECSPHRLVKRINNLIHTNCLELCLAHRRCTGKLELIILQMMTMSCRAIKCLLKILQMVIGKTQPPAQNASVFHVNRQHSI